MIILCQGDFKEQTNKLLSLLLQTTEICWRKYLAWVYFYPVSNIRVKYESNGYNFHPQATPGMYKPGRLLTRATKFCTVATNIFSIINAVLFCTYKYISSHAPSRKRQITSKVHRSVQDCGSPEGNLLHVTLLEPRMVIRVSWTTVTQTTDSGYCIPVGLNSFGSRHIIPCRN